MKITGDWLSRTQTQAVCAALTGAGFRALLVGGCVRNTLLGEAVADVDIATDAEPAAVLRVAEAAGLKAVPTGIAHGTITVIADGIPHEVTTFRRDVETFGRHATVAFSDRVEDDAARRDFTMNALYATPDGTLIDPLGGLPDLRARRLRFVGHAADRIAEDYLRILRFFRFHAWYGDPSGGLDAEALAACAEHAPQIRTLSRERVGAEMRKLLSARDPAPAVAAMARTGVLAQVLPGAEARSLPVLVHLEEGRAPDWLRRLSVLAREDLTEDLRLSRAEATTLRNLQSGIATTWAPAELGYRFGRDTACNIVLARAALQEFPPPPAYEAEATRGADARFPVSAADLMPALSGPALGERLAALEAQWVKSGFQLTREQLLA